MQLVVGSRQLACPAYRKANMVLTWAVTVTVCGVNSAVGAGGVVLPLPAWMTPDTTELPREDEIRPWFVTVCGLWDDPGRYAKASRRARAEAEARFAEPVMRRRYCDYFEALGPGGDLFDSLPMAQ